MTESSFRTREVQQFEYVDEGNFDAPVVLLLHGMLGGIGNWTSSIDSFSRNGFRVIAPFIPMYSIDLEHANVQGLVSHVRDFIEEIGLERFSIVGNSMGGHLAVIYAQMYPDKVESLVLTGASGIYEMEWGQGVIKRRNRDFIREKAAITFYDPKVVTDELLDFLGEIGESRDSIIRLLKIARSSKIEKVEHLLPEIQVPTLLIWGEDDKITPPFVANEFHENLSNAELVWFKKCGHAPMIEHPDKFNQVCLQFLQAQLINDLTE